MDGENLMELDAARQIMEEQGKERRAGNASAHAYNKAGLLACTEAMDARLPFTDSFVTKCKLLELDNEDVHDDIKRLVVATLPMRTYSAGRWVNCCLQFTYTH